MNVIIFDTETTGKNDPQIIEAAYLQLGELNRFLPVTDKFERRYRPDNPIELGAIATHHILDEELQECPHHTTFSLPEGVEYMIGHNVDYDWTVSGCPDVKRICTLALARKYLPDLDSHTQSALLYFFARSKARELLKNAHSALADVENCRLVLMGLLNVIGEVSSWDHLYELSEVARVPTHMPFGKHKGELISKLPASYKAWLINNTNPDQYLLAALAK